MKAIVQTVYGGPDVLQLRDVERPVVTDDGVLVRVRASSVNPVDWHLLTGKPYIARPSFGLLKPKQEVLGVDFAGVVEAIGKEVKQFQVGDEVFGGQSGALAEYVCVREDRAVVLKPANVAFEEGGAVAVAGVTALQALRDKGNVQPGQQVLINGASGGVGTFAVQIAKALGAQVTAVCRTGNVDMVRGLGADRVIDYTAEDFTRGDQRYDLMIDIAGSKPWSAFKRVLKPQATYVVVGGPDTNSLLGPLSHLIKVRLASLRSSQRIVFFVASVNKPDMLFLRDLLETGKVKPVIDRRYALSETAEALRYLGAGHAKAKIVVAVPAT
jgi:NADPH:quinone reductase-like Zn-dependent oxidoreductase